MATRLSFDVFARDRASQTFDDVGDRVDRTGSRFSKFAGVAAAAGAIAAAAIFKFGSDSVQAFVEAERSGIALQESFRKFPALADSNIGRFQALNAELAKKTKYDDDATGSGQAVLAQFKLTGTQVEQLTPLLQDYAARTGKDLPTAAKDLGKAILGQGKSLKAIGLDFKDTGSAAGNFDQLMGGLRRQVGGFAEKEGGTAAGKAEILKNQFGELQESVGGKLLPVLTKLADGGLKVVSWIDRNQQVVLPLVTVLGGLAVAVWGITAATSAWTAIQGAFNVVMAMNPVVAIVLGIGLLIGLIVLAYKRSETFRSIVQGALGGVRVAIGWVVNAAKAVWNWISANWPLLLAIMSAPFRLAQRAVSGALGLIRSGASAAVSWVRSAFTSMVSFVTGLPGRIGRAARGMWGGIVSSLRDALNAVIGLWNRVDFGVSLSVPSWVPGIGGNSWASRDVFPDISYLAAGGIVPATPGGRLAVIGEGRSDELVAPLPPGGLAGLMAGGAGRAVTQKPVVLQIDGQTLVQFLIRHNRRTGELSVAFAKP